MKKRLAVILAGTLAFSMLLSGCSSNEASNDNVTVTGYKGIEVAKGDDVQEITDEDVDNYINSILEQNAVEEPVTDRAVESGDTATINFAGKVDGAEFEGGSGEDYPLVIGSGSFIEGFEDSVIGHNVGDTYDWNGKFPDPYTGNPDMSGKDVVFTITVNSISKSTAPELTDDFVKSVSEDSKTVKEYKKEVKKTLEKNAEDNNKSELKDKVWTAVMDKAEVKKYPKKELKEISDQLVQQYKDAAEYYQMDYEEFIKTQTGGSVEDFEKQVEEAAKSSVKQNLVAEVIADKEKLEPSEKEYKAEFKKLAKQYGYEDVDALKEAADEDTLKQIVVQDIVKDWLTEHCVQVVQDDTKESKEDKK